MSVIGIQNGLPPTQRRDRPRLLTGVFLLMCLVVLFGAFASRNNLLYWFVGMAIGAILVHGLTAGPPMMRIMLGRVHVPDLIDRGETAVIRVTLISGNRRRAARALRIRAVLRSSSGKAVFADAGLAAIGPGETRAVALRIACEQRGIYQLESLRIATTFPFGLSRKELRFDVAGRMVCLPSESALSSDERRRLLASVTRRAADTQPAEIREYVRGDARRLIAWRASARAQRLLVRDMESERGQRLWLRLHGTTDALARRDPDAERMLDRAIAVGRHASELRYRVGIIHGASGVRVLPPEGALWEPTLAELGDHTEIVTGPPPGREDLVIDLHPSPEHEEAGDE